VVLTGDMGGLLQTTVGGLAARVAVGAVASTVFALVFVPVMRALHRCAWRSSRACPPAGISCPVRSDRQRAVTVATQWKRRVALMVDAMVLCGVLVLAGLFAYYSAKLLRIYSCDALLLHQLLPFALSVVIKSVFPGVLVIVLMYFVSAGLGRVQ
jgi:hypothetical protein